MRLLSIGMALVCLAALPAEWSQAGPLALAGQIPQAEGPYEAQLRARRAEMEELRRRIEAYQREAAELAGRERNLLQELQLLEQELEAREALIRALGAEEGATANEVERLTHDLVRAREELTFLTRLMEWRLREIYKQRSLVPWEALLTASSFAEAISRFRYLRLIANQDRLRVTRMGHLRDEVEARATALRERAAGLADEEVSLRLERATLARRELDRHRLLRRISTRKAERLQALQEAEAEARRIEALIAELERKRLAARPPVGGESFPVQPGELDWPVEGEVVASFGRRVHPIYRTRVINNGIDIAAESGTPVRAVAGGRVEFARWLLSYGRLLILSHPGGYYTLYAHLEDVTVTEGEEVVQGQVIGHVGATGSLEGPRLHFELREQGKAVNPLAWLRRP